MKESWTIICAINKKAGEETFWCAFLSMCVILMAGECSGWLDWQEQDWWEGVSYGDWNEAPDGN